MEAPKWRIARLHLSQPGVDLCKHTQAKHQLFINYDKMNIFPQELKSSKLASSERDKVMIDGKAES